MHSEILARIYSTKTISEESQWSFFRRRWTPCRRNVGTSEFFYQVLISSFTIKLNRLRWCWWWMLESLQMETIYIEPTLLVIDFIHHHHRPSRQTPRKSYQHEKCCWHEVTSIILLPISHIISVTKLSNLCSGRIFGKWSRRSISISWTWRAWFHFS